MSAATSHSSTRTRSIVFIASRSGWSISVSASACSSRAHPAGTAAGVPDTAIVFASGRPPNASCCPSASDM